MGVNRERRSQRLFWAAIVCLCLLYLGIKYHHVALAFQAYQGQPLIGDTRGAAK